MVVGFVGMVYVIYSHCFELGLLDVVWKINSIFQLVLFVVVVGVLYSC